MNQLVVHKPAYELRREMVKDAEIMKVLEPVEKAVFIASTSVPISEIEPVALGNDLRRTLVYIFKDVGFRVSNDSEMVYLVTRVSEILKRYFGGLSMRDFKMAFEMSITGALDEYLPRGRDGQPDRGHYQQFNAEYVCKILNAYKARRAAIMKKVNDAVPEQEPERNPDLEKYYLNRMKTALVNSFKSYKETGAFPEISPIAEMLYYEMLSSVGLAKEIEVTAEEQRFILQRTINQYARKGMVGDVRRLQQEGPDARELQHGAFSMARKKALKAAFERMVADGIEITDYIKIECTE